MKKSIRKFLITLGLCGLTFNIAIAAKQPVKIGVLTDMTGVYADFSGPGSVEAAKMAIKDFGGKVLDRPIQLIFADHQNKADVAATIARRWYERDNVDMITDLTNSAVAIAVQGIAKSLHKIDIATSSTTTALTNKDCSPWGLRWGADSYALASGTAKALVHEGYKTWFFITVDYAFGHDMENNATAAIKASGGRVVGHVEHPLNTRDFSSYLIQAKASGAQVIALANGGNDTTNAIKQAVEFGITKKQKLAGLLLLITDVHSLTLPIAQGLVSSTPFYWGRTPESRAWAKRFYKVEKKMPTYVHAATYSAVMHYLKAVQEAGSTNSDAVMGKLRAMHIHDVFADNGFVRKDGLMVHDMYLAEVKSPSESKGPWDYYKIISTVPGDQAFAPLSASLCPLLGEAGK